MTNLINLSRRWFLLLIAITIFVQEVFSLYIVIISFAFLVIYNLAIEALQRYKTFQFPYNFLVNFIDILFVVWFSYQLNQELFLLFCCFFIGLGVTHYNKSFSFILLSESIALISLLFFVPMTHSHFSASTNILEWMIIIGVFIFAYHIGSILNDLQKKNTDLNVGLKQRLKAKDSILSTLAHELRTPLTMIKSSSDIILEGRPGKINEDQVKFLKTIRGSTLRLTLLVEDILAQIKIESTWVNVKLKTIDIRPIVQKVINNIEPLIDQKHQTIRYSFPKLVPKVLADSTWIEQVLINLIHNASKYTSVSGHMVVSVKENEKYLVISVGDDGLGIKNNEKMQIFNEFYRSNKEFSNDTEGVGLGLAIVRHVVDKHHGKVYVGSIPGMGSIFSFTLKKEGEF